MAVLDSMRSKLNGLFNRLGSSITVYPLSSETVDKWGDNTPSYGTGVVSIAVPYNYLPKERYYEPFGDLLDGQVDIVIPYDTVIDGNSKVTYDGSDYKVMGLEKFVIANGVIAQLLRLQRII
jgi:hypothetical protein